MAGLPKKYAKMGFSRGWKAYRAASNRSRSSEVTKKMARRKKSGSRASKKSRSKGSRQMLGLGKYVGAAIYGGVREKLSDALVPVTSKIPLGNLSDEAGMIGVLFLAKKFAGGKVPLVKDIADAGLLIESARVGATIASGQLNLGGSAQATAASSGVVIIG